MARESFKELLLFMAVARHGSFTRAAEALQLTQPAISRAISGLERSLGVKLLERTTRRVSATEAGQRLLDSLTPRLEEIDREVQALTDQQSRPSGTLRINATESVISSVLVPRLSSFIREYPEVRVELVGDYGLADIVASRCDAGIRLGDSVAKDMISVRIGPDYRFLLVATPGYLAGRVLPRTPHELTEHCCINLRLPTYGGLYAWEFSEGGRDFKVRVEGQLVFNNVMQIVEAALDGFGIAYVPEPMVRAYVDQGRLVSMLEPWCPVWSGYFLYYPSRRQVSPALSRFIERVRYRPEEQA